jgi:hypothetical protein
VGFAHIRTLAFDISLWQILADFAKLLRPLDQRTLSFVGKRRANVSQLRSTNSNFQNSQTYMFV